MADLTRLLARALTRLRQGHEPCAPKHDTAGLFHPLGTPRPTDAHATSQRTAWQVFGMAGLLCFGLWASAPAQARGGSDGQAPTEVAQRNAALDTVVPLSALPRQAQDVHQRILAGGPFRYAKDGVVFGNRERLLPRQPRGFYREYTVPTPGERDRGARRIVCGGKEVRQPETCFYTGDHYASFQTIDPRH